MKAFFLSLCVFVFFAGLLRCMVNEERFSKYFSLISGILLLVLIVKGLPKVQIELPDLSEQSFAPDNTYEETVLARSEKVLSDQAKTLLVQHGIDCTVSVSLSYENDAITLEKVCVEGIRRSDAVVRLLSEYFLTEEEQIEFNG